MRPAVRSLLRAGVALTLTLAAATAGASPDLRFLTEPTAAAPGAAASAVIDLGTASALDLASRPVAPSAPVAPASAAFVHSTIDWSLESNTASRYLGESVTPLGDVNGDGYSDFAASGEVGISATALYLFFGSPSGPALAPGYPVTNLPYGGLVAATGDVNGDGYNDLALLHYSTGIVRVYLGNSTGLDLAHPTVLTSLGLNLFGFNGAPAGDVNGDGYGDFVVGVPTASGGFPCSPSAFSGEVVVFYGSASGLTSTSNWIAYGCYDVGTTAGVGTSVAGAGDVNADGYDDIIVGAPGFDNFGAATIGRAYVMYGSASGLPLLPGFTNVGRLGAGTPITGHHNNAGFANTVCAAGDVNGDGYADVAIGAPNDDNYGTDAGMAFVYKGTASGVDTSTAGLLWYEAGPTPSAHMGITLAPAGDVNGDARPDLLVGESSRVDLAQGSGGTMIIQQTLGYAQPGIKVVTAGDVNGDGLSDLLVGDSGFTNPEASEGRVAVHYGIGAGPMLYPGWSTTQTAIDNPNLGWSVSSAGDVNGDGYDDVLVGEPTWYNFTVGGSANNGLVMMFYGHATGLSASPDWFVYGNNNDQLGISVTGADLNGDGYSDIVCGAHAANGSVGLVRVWNGGPSGPSSGAASVTINGVTPGGYFGNSVAPAGDVNGDGYNDLIVGAPYATDPVSPLSQEGRAYVFAGGAGGLNTSALWSRSGGQTGAHYGQCVAGAGDVNGDGFSDVVVGAPDYDTVGKLGIIVTDGGITQVGFGGPSGPSAVATLQYTSAGAHFGSSVAGAGDVNGDGYSDIVVGAPSATFSLSSEGMARVYTGGPGNLLSLVWSQYGTESFGGFGSAVATAGDVDGDGLSDVLIGAVFQDVGGASDRGAGYVFRGPLPAGAAPFFTATGANAFDNMGHALASAGDVNGDGWNDLIFGEPGHDGSGYRQGYAQVRYGAGWDGLFQLTRMYHLTAPARPMEPGDQSDPGAIALLATGRSAAGRTRLRMHYRVNPPVGLPVSAIEGFTPWVATNAPNANGSLAALITSVPGLTNGIPYAWSLRGISKSIYFPSGIWRMPPRSGRLETDFRAPGAWIDVATAVPAPSLGLAEARPNPMRGSTTLAFSLSRPGPARLDVVDVQGRRVRTLASGPQGAGEHRVTWDGRDDDGRGLDPGIYFVRLEAEGQHLSRKVARMR